MMDALVLYSSSTNPYRNLALEEYLLNFCRINQKPVLYLWQNANTVVVGKNQNIFTECNMQFLRERDIMPSRRITGGGAVYHDLGNVNYTIITPKEMYNIEKNTEVIVEALKACGLDAFKNGRNDICTPNGKISGNAYFSDDQVGLQHGTILYKADVVTMEGALSVSEGKLSKKGIKSVRSRVCDVVSQIDNVSLSDIKESIVRAFLSLYKISEYTDHIDIEKSDLDFLYRKYSSKEWIEGKIKEYSFSKKTSLSFGDVELQFVLMGETISDIEVYTDCIDLVFVESLKKELKSFTFAGFRDNVLIEHKDWTDEFNDFLKQTLTEMGFDYADKRM